MKNKVLILYNIGLLFLNLILKNYSLAQQRPWEQTNGPFGGTINMIWEYPNDVLFAKGQNNIVYQSLDDGITWKKVIPDVSRNINSFVIDESNNILIGTSNGLFRSKDIGKSWERLISPIANIYISKVISYAKNKILAYNGGGNFYFSPDNGYSWKEIYSSEFLSTVNGIIATKNNDIFITTSNGVYHSTNDGSDFEQVNKINLNSIVSDSLGILYGSVSSVGVYKSIDSGKTWNNVSLPYMWVDWVAIGQNNRLYSAGFSGVLYSSTDYGRSWYRNTLDVSQINCILFNKKGNVFLGTTEDGILRAKSDTVDFEPSSNGIINSKIYALQLNNRNEVLAASQSKDLFISKNSGKDWTLVKRMSRINTFAKNKKGYIFAGTEGRIEFNGGIFRSTDDGYSWQAKNNGIIFGQINNMSIDSSDRIFAIYVSGLIRSTDDGESWIDITNNLRFGGGYFITSNSEDHIFLGMGLSIYRSTDHGNSWGDIGKNITGKYYNNICFNSRKEVFITSTDGYIYKSTNNGNDWIQIGSDRQMARIWTMLIDKNDQIYITGEDGGVFNSRDNGKTWQKTSNGLLSTSVRCIQKDNYGNLFVGTDGDGVFRNLNSTSSIPKIPNRTPEKYLLEQNYPNPFNSLTNISFDLPFSGFLTLKVYNVLGKEVRSLIEEYRVAGRYSLQFDATGLPSGIYYAKLRTNSIEKSIKMLFLK